MEILIRKNKGKKKTSTREKKQTYLLVPHPASSREVYLRIPAEVEQLRGASGLHRGGNPVVASASTERVAPAHFFMISKLLGDAERKEKGSEQPKQTKIQNLEWGVAQSSTLSCASSLLLMTPVSRAFTCFHQHGCWTRRDRETEGSAESFPRVCVVPYMCRNKSFLPSATSTLNQSLTVQQGFSSTR